MTNTTVTAHSYTMSWWAGYEREGGVYDEFDAEVEFECSVIVEHDFDGDWRIVESGSVDIESVNTVEEGDILERMDEDELERLRERCAEWAQGR